MFLNVGSLVSWVLHVMYVFECLVSWVLHVMYVFNIGSLILHVFFVYSFFNIGSLILHASFCLQLNSSWSTTSSVTVKLNNEWVTDPLEADWHMQRLWEDLSQNPPGPMVGIDVETGTCFRGA